MTSNKNTEKQTPSNPSNPPVAIIGMGCIFPRGDGLNAYWRLLFEGRDAIAEVPPSHWSAADYFDADPKRPDHVYCTRGGFISPVSFDPSEFGIPPASLEATDTSQLLGLVAAKRALEDAGYGNGRRFDRERTSVLLGVTGTQELVIPLGARLGFPRWKKAMSEAGVEEEKAQAALEKISETYVSWQENSFPGLLGNVVAGRICNRLDLGGTNCVVDAACASSMSAIHLGLMELYTGRSEMVITGGVDMLNDIFMHMCFSRTQILSPTGDVRPFSAKADGTVLGEGIGILAFKRLEDAERDGDRIYAVIRGIGSSSDGKSQSIYAPRAEGQARALKGAYDTAGIDPRTVELVEAHGTGTRVGDAVEIKGLKSVFAADGEKIETPWCAVGSVKSMIGHTKAAAGAAGLIKTTLALHHKVLPPTLKIETPDPNLGLEESPFYLNSRSRPWIGKEDHPRRAGVSAFGFGGSNFHLVMEEYGDRKREISWNGSTQIFAFSGASREAVVQQVEALKEQLGKAPAQELTEEWIAYAAASTRLEFSGADKCRLLLLYEEGKTPETPLSSLLGKGMGHLSGGPGGEDIFYGEGGKPGKIAFLFPGQGSQYVDMGRDLACIFPHVLEAIEAVAGAVGDDFPLGRRIFPLPTYLPEVKKQQEEALRQTNVAQPAIAAISLGMLEILTDFGVRPDAVCGHSFGELTALYAAGAIDREPFLDLAVLRGRVMAQAGGGKGGMLAVKAPLEEIEGQILSQISDLVLANRNTPQQGVLSGSDGAIASAEVLCRKIGWKAVRLPVSAPFHSPAMEAATAPFAEFLRKIEFKSPAVPVYANTTAAPYPDDPDAARNLLSEQLIRPVDFVGEIRNLYESGVRTFIEVGPKSVLTGLVRSITDDASITAGAIDASSGARPGISDLAKGICRLAALGYPVRLENWEAPAQEPKKQRMSIPLCGANYRSPNANANRSVQQTKKPAAAVAPESRPATEKSAPETAPASKAAAPSETAAAQRSNSVSPSSQKTAPARPAQNSLKPMERKAQSHQSHPARMPQHPQPQRNSSATDALRVVEEGLKSMQALQMQTAQTHQKFLESQTQAGRTLQEMVASTRRLAEAAAGIAPAAVYPSEQVADASMTHPSPAPETPQPFPEQRTAAPEPSAAAPQFHPEESASAIVDESVSKAESPPAEKTGDSDAIPSLILDVVSGLTGYPPEMLSFDMDIEADLGIDSIKRVEILSTLEERMPELPPVSPEIMGTLRTLGEIVEHLKGQWHTSSVKEKMPAAALKGSGQRGQSRRSGQSDASDKKIRSTLLEVVSGLTGYPAEMLSFDMDIESDLGIDSIKRVEILSAFEEQMPELPPVSPEIMGTLRTLGEIVEHLGSHMADEATASAPAAPSTEAAPSASESASSPAEIEKILLEVVSGLTGYPVEMLSLEMDIESDLGIDSIKRVEILSAFEEQMPELPPVSPEIMGTLRTLGEIIDHLCAASPSAAPTLSGEPQPLREISGPARESVEKEEDPEILERKEVRLVSLSGRTEAPISFPENSAILITEDGKGLARAIAAALAERQIESRLIPPNVSPDAAVLENVSGLVLLGDAWEENPDDLAKEAFSIARETAPRLMDAARQRGAVFLTVSRMDGAFGFSGKTIPHPQQGALSGLAKTAALEWEDVSCRAVDLPPAWTDMEAAGKAVAAELLHTGPPEVGLSAKGRCRVALETASPSEGKLNLSPGDPVVITGGARGVTASAAIALAQKVQPTLLLMGRSPLPGPEPEWLEGLSDAATIKRAILENQFAGSPPSPKDLEAVYRRYMAGREIAENLERMQAAGATVRYYSGDVRDEKAVKEIFQSIRKEFGPIRGIIHGAGYLQDRRITDKTDEQFEAVFSTKVKGLEVLLWAAADDPLKYLILFSSVAGRMGNQGQVDYAMANEVISKMAQNEAANRPDCRVISVAWGPWDGGMVSDALKKEFRQRGIGLIPIEAGAQALVREMAVSEKNPAVKAPVEVIIGSGFGDREKWDMPEVKEPEPVPAPKAPSLSLTFKREIDQIRYPILDSHRIAGRPVVPFALMTEWLGCGALHENPGLFLQGLDQIRLLNGIRIDEEKKLIRLMAGKARKNGSSFEVDVEIRDGVQEGMEVIHYRAKAILGSSQPSPPPFDPSVFMKGNGYPRTIDDIYENVLFHGAELRGIKKVITLTDRFMTAKLAAAPAPDQWMKEPVRSRWIGDPLVLDSAFQMAILWAYEQKEQTCLPSYAESYRQFTRRFPAEGVTAILEIREVTDHKMKGDFTFLNESNDVVARLTGYEAVMDPSLIRAFKKSA